ncbi:MAG TPA: flagellar basal body rod protein FlgC [Sedimentisphaerales bacterium]|nr:flagellar basal body rod protein FlgC [Sedimentisphaerales bacterium]
MEVSSSFGPIDIAVSGMQAQNKQIGAISSNVANAQSTDNGDGSPYRRLEAIFRAVGDEIDGVTVDEIAADMSEFPRILKPGHPDADDQGYVSMPNVDLPIEMINLTVATRAYQANVAVMKRYQRMVESTLELLR